MGHPLDTALGKTFHFKQVISVSPSRGASLVYKHFVYYLHHPSIYLRGVHPPLPSDISTLYRFNKEISAELRLVGSIIPLGFIYCFRDRVNKMNFFLSPLSNL
ncbi:hypothetical protein TNCV_1110771 [Trichonephila clavipes]|nr:hypothetical protein TNCV_1110771 [Trichonephila clavipes]